MDLALDRDVVGRDFDQWLDWDGTVNMNNDVMQGDAQITTTDPFLTFPMSPSSTAHSDSQSGVVKPKSLTAHPTLDLPTPTHTSSSPETRASFELRLSGEILQDAPVSTTRRTLKRKPAADDNLSVDNQHEELTPAAKKRPHNVIEKRYRANLNEKIAELRDSVPSLRIAKTSSKVKEGSKSQSDNEDLDGLAPSNKLNKASILSKAVEYIRHLEFRTRRLEDENRSLRERLETLDKVIAQGGQDAERAAAFTSENLIEETSPRSSPGSTNHIDEYRTQSQNIQGLIPLPESWRRLRQNQSQDHYGLMYDTPTERRFFRGKMPGRIMLGSLATLMILDGFAESDQGTESREKGLFGIPLELLDGWKFLRSPQVYLSTFAQFCQAGGIFPLIKGFLALTILAFFVFAYLFNSKPAKKEDVEEHSMHSTHTPTPSSPIEVRRQAWSTSMQVLRLPHHSFFPEWIAVTSEWLHYTIRCVFGARAYRWYTGRTIDDDIARTKAWDIAVDAQLAGGDVEVSRSRVLLTSFGSGPLARTPVRLMLKALHCRVLLWNMGKSNTATFRIADKVGKFFANREWQKARRLHENTTPMDADRLPNYLSALLEMECDDVITETVLQRAYNLMYDRPTQEDAEDDLMDVVVEDHAVKSPLDAIAAWRSTCSLRKGLELSLQNSDASELIHEYLSLALRIAPAGSTPETRALAACAIFATVNRNAYYTRVNEAMKNTSRLIPTSSSNDNIQVPIFIDSSTPISARPDIINTLNCAKTLLILDQTRDPEEASKHFFSTRLDEENISILTFAATTHTLAKLSVFGNADMNGSPSSIKTAGAVSATTVIREAMKSFSHIMLTASMLHNIYQDQPAEEQKGRRQSTASNDTGYESQEDPILTNLRMTPTMSV